MKSRLEAFNSWLASRTMAECGLVLAFVAALFCFNVLTATLYSITVDDEALFTDPAANLYMGHGFTSSAWKGQDKDALWSGNLPLYSLTLSQWLKITGFGLTQVRSLSYFLISLAIVAFWLAVKRLQWLKMPVARLLFIGIAFLSFPLFDAYRVARYDSLQILMSSLILLAWSLRAGTARQILLFVLGVVIATSGFQAVAYIGLIALILVAWQRKDALWPAGALICGLGVGVTGILGFYYTHGILDGFLATVRWAHSSPSEKIQRVVWGPFSESGVTGMTLILLLLLSQRSLCVWDKIAERLIIAGLACSYVIIVGLELAVHYTTYYHWMNQLVLVGFVCAVLERTHSTISGVRKVAIFLILSVSLALSIPKNIFLSLCFGEGREYRALEKFVGENIHADDTVFVDYLGLFPVKAKNVQVYMPAYLDVMTREQEESVTVLLVKNLNNGGNYAKYGDTYADWFSKNGQKWKLVATMQPEHNKLRDLLEHFFPRYVHGHDSKTCGYRMSIYRKSNGPA